MTPTNPPQYSISEILEAIVPNPQILTPAELDGKQEDMGINVTAYCKESWNSCVAKTLSNTKQAEQAINQLIYTQDKVLLEEFAEFCHEHYTGCYRDDGEELYNYGYSDEIVNLVPQFLGKRAEVSDLVATDTPSQEKPLKSAQEEIYSQVLELIDSLYEYDTVAVERATYQDENFVCVSKDELRAKARAK
jgi:hypothetical protein